MRGFWLWLSLAVFFNHFFLLGQETHEPEYIGHAFYVNHDLQSLESLERERIKFYSKSTAKSAFVGETGKKLYLYSADSVSDIVVKGTSSIQFLVKCADNNIDPNNQIHIYKLLQSTKLNMRYLVADWLGILDYDDVVMINFTGERYGTSSFIITIDEIPAGEYALRVDQDREFWNLFRVAE